MADNITLDPGSGGAVLATDDLSSVHHQYVKVEYGADNSATPVSPANPMPVELSDGTDTALVTAAGELNVLLGANTGVDIGDVDVLSIIPGVGATNLGKTLDVAVGAADTGVLMLGVRRDADTTLVNATNDLAPFLVDANGYLKVEIFDGGDTLTVGGTVTATPAATGGGVEAGAQRVTIANDSTGLLSVDFGGTIPVFGGGTEAAAQRVTIANDSTGVLTVDGTVTADAGTGDFLSIAAHTINEALKEAMAVGGQLDDTAPTAATENNIAPVRITAQRGMHTNLRDVAGDETGVVANPLIVTDDGNAILVDGSGVTQPVSGTVTVTHPALGGGVEAGAQRVTIANDSTGVLSIDDGGNDISVDWAGTAPPIGAGTEAAALRVTLANDSTGQVTIDGTVTANAGTGDFLSIAGHTANEAFKESMAIGGMMDDAATTLATEGNVSAVRITAERALMVNLRTEADAEIGTVASPLVVTDDGNAILVDGSGVTQPVSGTVTVTHPALGGGTEAGAQRVTIANDSTGVLSIDDGGGDISVDWAGTAPPIGAGTEAAALRVTLATDSTGQVTIDGTVTASNTAGDVAHDTADSGNPVKIGAVARVADPTAVAGNDRVNVYADDVGKLVNYPFAPRDLTLHNRIALTTTTETTLIALDASNFHDLVGLYCSNESATECRIDFRDSTAGTIRFSIDLAADGGGAVVQFPVPLKQAAINNNWTAQLSAAVSTVYITGLAIKNI
jgi:hypothetical protein